MLQVGVQIYSYEIDLIGINGNYQHNYDGGSE